MGDGTEAVDGDGGGDEGGEVAGEVGDGVLDAVYELDEGGHGAVGDDAGLQAEDAPAEGGEVTEGEAEFDEGAADPR